MISPNIFFSIIVATVLTIRLSVYLVPNKDVIVFGKVVHHMWFGVLLVLMACLAPIKVPFVTAITSAVGLGLIADHIVYMLLGAGGDDKYWSHSSLLGVLVVLVLLFLLRTQLFAFFA